MKKGNYKNGTDNKVISIIKKGTIKKSVLVDIFQRDVKTLVKKLDKMPELKEAKGLSEYLKIKYII